MSIRTRGPSNPRRRTLFIAAGLVVATSSLILAQTPTPTRQPAVRGVLPGGPIFDPARPKPPVGNVLDIESLVVAPSDEFRVERRNNFYKKDGSDGLYRWAASGHWSNYDEARTGNWKASVPDLLDAREWPAGTHGRRLAHQPPARGGEAPRNAHLRQDSRERAARRLDRRRADESRDGRRGDGVAHDHGRIRQRRRHAVRAAAHRRSHRRARAVAAAPAGPGAGRGRGLQAAPNGLAISYTIPANAPGKVPLIQGGNAAQVLAMGFGTVTFAGNAPNVMSQPAAKDDWGEIRKYGWVVSRALDYLETDPLVDARQVALTGHSIGGKRALVAGAFDERIGLVFASCSGEGGASMMRRDWGETLDDLAQLSPQNYAENFQMWVRHWDEMPADAHMLVALMAPRPLFITGGTEDQWSDPVGVFWSGFYATPVYTLLGKKGLSGTEPPQPNVFLDGDLTFYNHIGGHITTPEESAKYLELAKKHFKVMPR